MTTDKICNNPYRPSPTPRFPGIQDAGNRSAALSEKSSSRPFSGAPPSSSRGDKSCSNFNNDSTSKQVAARLFPMLLPLPRCTTAYHGLLLVLLLVSPRPSPSPSPTPAPAPPAPSPAPPPSEDSAGLTTLQTLNLSNPLLSCFSFSAFPPSSAFSAFSSWPVRLKTFGLAQNSHGAPECQAISPYSTPQTHPRL